MAKPRIDLSAMKQRAAKLNTAKLGAVDLSDVDLQIIDVKKYDFEDLRNDVSDILSVQQAAVAVLKWAVAVPVLGSVITWLIFSSRMSSDVFAVYMLVVVLAFLVLGVSAGIFFALRSRIAQTNKAADRVVELTSEVHADYLKVRTGETELPAGALAAALSEQLIFPALTGGIMSAATMAGPMAVVIRPVAKRSLAAVEQRVIEALHNTPMPMPGLSKGNTNALVSGDPSAADLVPTLPTEISDWYLSVHSGLRRVVSGVSIVATGSMGLIMALTTLPIVALFLLGWLLT